MTDIKHIRVAKTARYAVLGTPGPHIKKIWFACHGYGQLVDDFITRFQPLDNGQNLIAAPEALNRFYLRGAFGKVGASWMTKQDRQEEISDYTQYLDAVYDEVTTTSNNADFITLLGFSQGTATACRWALKSQKSFHRLILWGGDFPPDTPWNDVRHRLDQLDIHLVYGDEDAYIKPIFLQRQREMLESNRVNYRLKTYQGGHDIHPETLLELARLQ